LEKLLDKGEIMEQKLIELKIDVYTLELILEGLGELKLKQSFELVNKLLYEKNRQLNPQEKQEESK
jgi:hypothetical protein